MKRQLALLISILISLMCCSRPDVDTLYELDRRLSAQHRLGLLPVLTATSLFLPASGHPACCSAEPFELTPGPWQVKGAAAARSGEMGLTWGWLFDKQRHYATLWRRHGDAWTVELQMNFIDTLSSPAWTPPPVTDARVHALLAADRAFAAMADTAGMAAAFAVFIADNGVAVGSGTTLHRKDDFITRAGTDRNDRLRWQPIYGRVARSGDFGFTLGRYTSAPVAGGMESPDTRGYYLSVWRKNASGVWRFIFDGGNTLPGAL